MSQVARTPSAPGANAGKAPRKALATDKAKKRKATGSVAAKDTTMARWTMMVGRAEALIKVYEDTLLAAGTVVGLPIKVDGPKYDLARIARLYGLMTADSEAIKALGDDSGADPDDVIELVNAYARGDTEAVSAMKPGPLLKAIARYIIYMAMISDGAQNHFEELSEGDDAGEEQAEDYEQVRAQLEQAEGDAQWPGDIGTMDCAEFGEYLEHMTEPDLGRPEEPIAAPAQPAPEYIA